MWSYYGAKTNVVQYYPKPVFNKIREPFCGSARYSLRYWENDILLMDKYPVIVKLWKWLQQCSPNDILSLPRRVNPGQSLNDFTFDCEEAKLLMGFLIKKGVERPAVTPTKWAIVHRPNFTNYSLKRIAENLFKIKHWKVELGSYETMLNEEATWFIDPPYQFGGQAYVHGSKKINFDDLAVWSREREGQIIVCENNKATWLDFKPMSIHHGSTGATTECIWSNLPTQYDMQQQKLFL